jgi:hypothetical protein
MELQSDALGEDHHRLSQISQDIGARTHSIENTVGI